MQNRKSSNNRNGNDNIRSDVQVFVDTANYFDPNIIQTANYSESALEILGIVDEARRVVPIMLEPYDTKEDYEWFTSGQVNTMGFEGKYIAIWRKQIVASADTAVEAERIAKAYCGNDVRPALILVPKNEDAIL